MLTLLGNGLLILINLLKAGMLWVGIENGGVGQAAIVPLKALLWTVILTCVGAALGAALMLGGSRLGYRIYAVSTIVHLIATACIMLLWVMTVYLSVVGVLLFFYCFVPVAFLLYFRLSQRLGSAFAAVTSVLTPAIALAVSAALEGWRPTALALAGIALTLLSVGLAVRTRR